MKHAPLRGDAPESLYFSVFPRPALYSITNPRWIIRLWATNQRRAGRPISQSETRKQTALISLTSWPLSTLATCQSWPWALYFIEEKRNFRIFCFDSSLYLCSSLYYVYYVWRVLIFWKKVYFFKFQSSVKFRKLIKLKREFLLEESLFSRHLFIFVNSQKLFLRQYICLFPGKKNPRIYERQYLQLSPRDIIIIPSRQHWTFCTDCTLLGFY